MCIKISIGFERSGCRSDGSLQVFRLVSRRVAVFHLSGASGASVRLRHQLALDKQEHVVLPGHAPQLRGESAPTEKREGPRGVPSGLLFKAESPVYLP